MIKQGYDKVYDAMNKLLDPEEMIFAEWDAGFGGILQWTLPKDMQWRSFSQADDYDKQAIVNEFMRLKEIGGKKLGTNEALKKSVYSIPSEASVYYTVTPEGQYRIMLTAWGYSFPTQAPMTDLTWMLPPEAQDITVRFVENGAPVANLPIDIHRNDFVLHHKLDANGEKYYGKLMPGSNLYIEVPSHAKQLTLTVMAGQNLYTFDLTEQKPVAPVIPEPVVPDEKEDEETEEIIAGARTIKVQMIGVDGKPIAQRSVVLEQLNRNTTTETTDDNGCIFFSTNDFMEGAPITLRLPDVPEQPSYVDASLIVEAEENDYAIFYKQRTKSNFWLNALLTLICAALTVLTIWGATKVDI